MPEASRKAVYAVIENDNLERPLFRRIGTAFVNRDDSLNILLDAVPLCGRLHVRNPEPRRNVVQPREDKQ